MTKIFFSIVFFFAFSGSVFAASFCPPGSILYTIPCPNVGFFTPAYCAANPLSLRACAPVLSYAGGPINCVSVGGAALSCSPATYGSPAAACASYNNPGTGTTAKYANGSCTVTDSHGNITHPMLDPMSSHSNTADPYIPTNTPASGVPTTTPTTTPSSGVPGTGSGSGTPSASGVPTTTPLSGVPGSGASGGSGGAGGAGGAGAPAGTPTPITCADINTCTTATPGTGAALPALPSSASGSWYVKTYPNGIQGVLTANFTTLKGTSLFGLIQNLVPTLNGTGSSGCFTLNVWKIGDQQLCIPPMVMNLLGIIMILTALFSARAIIFGG